MKLKKMEAGFLLNEYAVMKDLWNIFADAFPGIV